MRRMSPRSGSARRVRGEGSCHQAAAGAGPGLTNGARAFALRPRMTGCRNTRRARRCRCGWFPGAFLSCRSRWLPVQTPASRKESADATCPAARRHLPRRPAVLQPCRRAAVGLWGVGGLGFGLGREVLEGVPGPSSPGWNRTVGGAGPRGRLPYTGPGAGFSWLPACPGGWFLLAACLACTVVASGLVLWLLGRVPGAVARTHFFCRRSWSGCDAGGPGCWICCTTGPAGTWWRGCRGLVAATDGPGSGCWVWWCAPGPRVFCGAGCGVSGGGCVVWWGGVGHGCGGFGGGFWVLVGCGMGITVGCLLVVFPGFLGGLVGWWGVLFGWWGWWWMCVWVERGVLFFELPRLVRRSTDPLS
ncbi:hypothetical protein JOF48_001462 [Arthrobacter stackebrandtii]|uniref:Uncharacterized protein n=1 Tax=Arthrobacter stackebrandtii TaxID=272161 RepID=A0ABS4YXE3_9MICC|nr:hypothetical protein [Arthrobacter stackebrandtii]